MEDIMDIEAELTHRLSDLQKRLEKAAHPDIVGKEVAKTQELIKANLQRSKVIQDQVSTPIWCKIGPSQAFNFEPGHINTGFSKRASIQA